MLRKSKAILISATSIHPLAAASTDTMPPSTSSARRIDSSPAAPPPDHVHSSSAPPSSQLTTMPSTSSATQLPNGDTSKESATPTIAADDPASGAPIGRSFSQHPLLAARARGLRTRIMRFTPSWFSVTMGTGIVNTLLFDLPWESSHAAFRAIGACFLVFDVILFLAFSIITVARYTLYPRFFTAMVTHEMHSLFLGTIPMGLVTIASGVARTGVEYGIPHSLNAGLALWWIATVMSVMTAFGVPFLMFTRHKHATETLTAAWLLPVVPTITQGAVGSSLCQLLMADNRYDYAFTILITSYIMTGIGVLLAMCLLVLYFQRLALHRLPPREVIVSTFLPLGPCGQAGFALIELGRDAIVLFPRLAELHPNRSGVEELAMLGPPLLGSGLMTALVLWGLGVWWTFLAFVSVGTNLFTKRIAFNMGFWGLTFPLGSMTLATFSMARLFGSNFFTILAAIMTFSVTLFWVIVFIPTVIGFFRGTLFVAPCLTSLPPEYMEKLVGGSERSSIVEAAEPR